MKQQVSSTAVVLWQESGELLGHTLEAAAATEMNAARTETALYGYILKRESRGMAAVGAVLGRLLESYLLSPFPFPYNLFSLNEKMVSDKQ